MQKNILLINPWIYDFAAYNLWIKPLGLYYLASYLKENGHNVTIIDCLDSFSAYADDVNGLQFRIPPPKNYCDGKFYSEDIEKPEALRDIARKYKRYGMPLPLFQKRLTALKDIDFVLVTSMMTYWYPAVWDAIRIAKQAFPTAPIVLGGNYATLCPEHLKGSGADFVLTGAAEDSFRYLQESIFGCDVEYLPNKVLPDSLPYPAFELSFEKGFLPIIASRGCPFRCSYCASHILNDGFYRRSPEGVIAEIEHWQGKYGTKNFAFYDDALLFKADEFFIPFAEMVLEQRKIFNFHCPNGLHIAEITSDVARLLKNVGFRTIRFGLETADGRRQIETGGKVHNEQFLATMAYLSEAGYKQADIGVYILCGLPHQSAREVEETIRFVWKNGGKPIIAEFSPIPKTKLWEEAISVSRYDLANEPLFHNNSLLACQGTNLSLADLQHLKMLTRAPLKGL